MTNRASPSSSHPAVNFRRQTDSAASDQSVYAEVLGVVMIHPYWDVVRLETADLPDHQVLSLSTKRPEDLEGRDIVARWPPPRSRFQTSKGKRSSASGG